MVFFNIKHNDIKQKIQNNFFCKILFFTFFSVYSYSKSHMWKLFFYLNSRECRFADEGASRLCTSDTDSISNNLERLRSNIEIAELYLLLNSGKSIPFLQSYHCKRYTEIYFKTMGSCIDYSSITEEVI